MTREEVIRTVGGPPGNYSGDENMSGLVMDADVWVSDDGLLVVRFDADGTAKGVSVAKNQPPTLTERIRRWLGL
jgi:hypothetical protein